MLKRIMLAKSRNTRTRNPEAKADFLRPSKLDRRISLPQAPGFTGSRPTLSVVLKILRSETEELVHYHLRIAMQSSGRERGPFMDLLQDPKCIRAAGQAMADMMRQLVDMWISSGKDPVNTRLDFPEDRNIEDLPAGYSTSLFETLWHGVLTRLDAVPLMWRDGTWEFQPSMPKLQLLEQLGRYEALGAVWKDHRDVLVTQIFSTASLIHDLSLDAIPAEHSSCEFGCDEQLRTGVYCTKCKGSGSVNRTAAIRLEMKTAMLSLGANAWDRWKKSNRHPDQRLWVAQQVNNRLGTRIGRKWVSQNLKFIEQSKEGEECQELRNAMGVSPERWLGVVGILHRRFRSTGSREGCCAYEAAGRRGTQAH